MMLSTALKLCLLVFFMDVFRALDDDMIPLVELTKLQIEHCNEALFCSFRTFEVTQNKSCCSPCSCKADCVEQNSCCPDYYLLDSIGMDVSYNLSEFSERLTTNNGVNVTTDQNRLTCVQASGPKEPSSYEKPEASYVMVISCPVTFNGNVEILEKCEEPQDIDTFEFDLFIPITSLKSEKTYRNKYCLLCNEESHGTTYAEYWASTMDCLNFYHLTLAEVTPHDIFTSLVKFQISNCVLIFSPNPDLVTHRCEKVDIETCPEGSDVHLNEICESFHLPVVYPRFSIIATRYRNIACYLCNSDKAFTTNCEKVAGINKEQNYGMELNIQRDENKNVVYSEEQENDILNVDVIKETNNTCGTGFIQIEDTCAKLLCPWNFYISKGECIPSFTQLQNLMFTAMLEVRRAELFGTLMLDEIRKNYQKEIAEIGKNMFHQFSYGLWEMQNDYDILVVSFTVDQSNYNYKTMVRQYVSFLDMVCMLTIKIESSAVKVSTFQTRSPYQAYSEMYDMRPTPKEIFKYEDPGRSIMRLEFHITHMCYRVAVPDSRMSYYLKNHYALFAMQPTKSDQILVCVADMLRDKTNISSAFMFGGTCAQTAVDFIKNKHKYKTTQIVNNDGNGDDDDNVINNDRDDGGDNNNNGNNNDRDDGGDNNNNGNNNDRDDGGDNNNNVNNNDRDDGGDNNNNGNNNDRDDGGDDDNNSNNNDRDDGGDDDNNSNNNDRDDGGDDDNNSNNNDRDDGGEDNNNGNNNDSGDSNNNGKYNRNDGNSTGNINDVDDDKKEKNTNTNNTGQLKNADDSAWTDTSKGLLIGGVAVGSIVTFVIVTAAILRKRTEQDDVAMESRAQDPEE